MLYSFPMQIRKLTEQEYHPTGRMKGHISKDKRKDYLQLSELKTRIKCTKLQFVGRGICDKDFLITGF